MTLAIPFDNSYAALPPSLFTRIDPTPVKAPRLLAFNHALAEELGVVPGDEAELARVFAGNEVPEGATPIAQRYAGHQFGQFNPQLGDGRAHLLGEVVDRHGRRRDIQLKGSGRTPYSRMGDGRAWMGPVLREYVVSEAMHALGIPTTRALAVVATGEPVVREAVLPGAVLTRVAASHIRVGTFQIFAARGDMDALKALYEHTVARHYPEADGPKALLDAVIAAQARLVAQWMSVGFIHGVMNTDNCAVSGETIDYGPCAFVDDYHPETVFSSIDRMGRYAYANQPDIAVWNMAQFATALVPLMPDAERAVEEFTQSVHAMPALLRAEWLARFRAKLGLATGDADDAALVSDLLDIMAAQGADFTNTFRGLAEGTARREFSDPAPFDAWEAKWRRRLEAEDGDPEARMLAANPAVIPRNHRIEHMIEAAVGGDMGPFETLMRTLATPYETPEVALLTTPPRPEERVEATFCGT
ncbi:MAG: protein adenylyltransferase SelO [Rhodosalinus sp.]